MLIGNSELLIVNLSNSKLRHLQYFEDLINILINFEIANNKHMIYPGDFILRFKAALKVVSTTFLHVCFVCLKESTCGTRENVFYFTSKALFILEISEF